ncbi:hypothetical protein FQZ97_732220 [compost metagenome]
MEELPGPVQLLRPQRPVHGHEQVGADMRRRRDHAGAAHADHGQGLQVLARQHIHIAVGDQRDGLLQRAAAVLDRGDVRMRRQHEQGRGIQRGAGPVGNVVKNQGEARSIGQAAEIGGCAFLPGAHVVRRGSQDSRQRARAECRQALQHVSLMVAGQAHDDGQRARLRQHGVKHGQLFGIVQGRGLAGAAAHDQPVHTRGGIVAHQAAQGPAIHGAAGKRRDERHPDALDRRLMRLHVNTPSV